MATVASAHGLKPAFYVGGRPYAGAQREYPVLSGYGTAIFQGDVVRIGAAGDTTSEGYLVKETGTSTTSKPIGVFMGVSYTDPNTLTKVFKNYLPASVVASDIKAMVVDDPDVIYEVQASGAVAQAAIGENCALVQGSGSTLTGMSGVTANATHATTDTLPLRIVGFVNRPGSAVGDTYTDLFVKFNFGIHAYEVATAR